MRYEWRGPQQPALIQVTVAAAELNRIQQRDGGITPGALVDESRPPAAPLHNAFEWDDTTAAESYRQQQARQVIRAIVLVPEPERRETMPVIRAFVSITNPAGPNPQSRIYRPVLAVLEHPVEGEELKRRMRNELENMRLRYMAIIEAEAALKAAMQQLITAAA